MKPATLATALASLLALGAAQAQTSTPARGMRETPLRFDAAFVNGKAPVPPQEGPSDCRPLKDAELAFKERTDPPADVPLPAEHVQWWDGGKAKGFILAAWTDAERRDQPGWGGVERVYVRTRPDIAGFAKVHFASLSRGFVCGFHHPILITAERMGYGINGRPQPSLDQAWPKGDPWPGMSREERDAAKFVYGLRNQLERGNDDEQRAAMEAYKQLLESSGRPNGAEAKPSPRALPSLDPKFAPTVREMQEGLRTRPRGCEAVSVENCFAIQRR